jgi:hypothetical protein
MGLVCEKMTDLVVTCQEEEDRRVRETRGTVTSIVGEDDGEEEDKEDDEGTEDETVI